MRLAVLAASLLVAAGAARAADGSRTPHQLTMGRRFFARVIQAVAKLPGKMVEEPELPVDRPYKYVRWRGLAAVDSSWCVAHIISDDNSGPAPVRTIDEGCTGLLSTTTLDWGNATPVPMTQRRLDELYASTYHYTFEEPIQTISLPKLRMRP